MNDKAIEKAAFNLAVDIQELYGLEIGSVPDIENWKVRDNAIDACKAAVEKAKEKE